MLKTALTSVLVTLLGTATARADARPSARFLLDGVAGVAIPMGDTIYRDANYPGPVFGLRLGAELWITPHLGLAPELALEGGPLMGHTTVNTGRARIQPGLRLLLGFGKGHAFFVRALLGADLLIFGPGAVGGLGKLDVGLVIEPGVGMQFRIARRAVLGFTVGTPVAFHSFHDPSYGTHADFEAALFVGYRR